MPRCKMLCLNQILEALGPGGASHSLLPGAGPRPGLVLHQVWTSTHSVPVLQALPHVGSHVEHRRAVLQENVQLDLHAS